MGTPSTPARYPAAKGGNIGNWIGGWVYEAEEQMEFAVNCFIQGFGLPSFDDFIDSLPKGNARDELMEWREKAFLAFKQSDNSELKAWLNAMLVNWRLHQTIDHAAPLAKKGKAFSDSKRGLSALYAVVYGILLYEGRDLPAKKVWQRLIEMPRDHPVIGDVNDEAVYWRSDKGDEKETTFKQFQKRLSEIRKKLS